MNLSKKLFHYFFFSFMLISAIFSCDTSSKKQAPLQTESEFSKDTSNLIMEKKVNPKRDATKTKDILPLKTK